MSLPTTPGRVQDSESFALSDWPTLADDRAARLPPLERLLTRLLTAHHRFQAQRKHGLLVILHGLDASGKDGTLRRLARGLDPAAFRVHCFVEPTPEQLEHEFLWRAWPRFPARGVVVGFNRSYYEETLTGRQDKPGLDTAALEQRFAIIRAMEQHLNANNTRVLKIFLHVSKNEQRRRLRQRLDDPSRQWKFKPQDLVAWQSRDQYLKWVEEMVRATHTESCPWYVVPADNKAISRALVVDLVCQVLEQLAPAFPRSDPALLARYRGLLD